MNVVIQSIGVTAHREPLAALWKRVFDYPAVHNDPELAIQKKLAADDGLFFVAEQEGNLVGSIMAGYDGHRGWLYLLAVDPECRRDGIGSRLVRHAEEKLAALGCPKINLQILPENQAVETFYRKLGYVTEERISMGKRLIT